MHPAGGRTPSSWRRWRTCWTSTTGPTTRSGRWSAWTRRASSSIGEVIEPLPAAPGQPERFDYEYARNGTANLFMISEPLLGWRARAGDRAADGGGLRRGGPLAGRGGARGGREGGAGDGQPEHAQAGLACTRRSRRSRPGGSPSGWRSTTRRSTAVWLNMAEIELSVLARQCLDRRIEIGGGAASGRWRRGRRSGTSGGSG